MTTTIEYYMEGSLQDPMGITLGTDVITHTEEGVAISGAVKGDFYHRRRLTEDQYQLIHSAMMVRGPHRGFVGLVQPEDRMERYAEFSKVIVEKGEMPFYKASTVKEVVALAKSVLEMAEKEVAAPAGVANGKAEAALAALRNRYSA